MFLIPNFDVSMVSFCPFFQLSCSNLRLKQCQKPYSYQIIKEIKFEVVWDELESKKAFQIQSVTKYLRLNLVFM